jgi:hypothetical protein
MVDLNGFSVVVTGFPRSGTSMMMRMLSFGGIDVIADEQMKNPQHKHDPYGCLELKNVGVELSQLREDETRNKAVKIVCPYATWIPVDRQVKAIFMLRDLTEIVTSLLAMKSIWDEDIAGCIAWARGYLNHNEIPTLFVQYKEVIKYPKATAIGICDFLAADLDLTEMVKAVDRDARTKYKKDDTLLGHDVPDKLLRIDKDAYDDLNVEVYHSPEDNVP